MRFASSSFKIDVMTTTPLTPSRSAPRVTSASIAPLLAGVGAVALAIYQVATPGTPNGTFSSASDFPREALTLVYLAGGIGGVIVAFRAGLAPQRVAVLISIGYGLIFIGVAVGLALREDPDWFMVLGGPGQLMSMAGFIAWAVWGKRHDVMSWQMALLCGIGGTVAFLGSEVGLSVLIAGFWFAIASRIRQAD